MSPRPRKVRRKALILDCGHWLEVDWDLEAAVGERRCCDEDGHPPGCVSVVLGIGVILR